MLDGDEDTAPRQRRKARQSMGGGDANNAATNATAAASEARMTVCVRTRPLSSTEIERGERSVVRGFCEDKVVRISKEARAGAVLRSEMGAQHEYQFDQVFGSEATQQDIYEATTQAIVMDALRGVNSTVFAYGATGAGKTHTMLGNPNDPGIIPRALVDLFRGIDRLRDDFDLDPRSGQGATKEWNVKLSYLEVYNETIYDLLTHKQRPLQPCEDPNDFQVKVLGLTEVLVNNTDQVLELLESGNKRRRMESTAANQVSSRSHAVIQVRIESVLVEPVPFKGKRRLAPKPKKTAISSVLSLIDLAGSERAAATQNRGARLREGANINRSLLALANCINALSSGRKATRVKYRDSKLTHLLKSSLEGNSSLCMIAAINPSNKCYEESHNTLKYANRAKDIKIKASVAAPVRRNVNSMGSEDAERLEELEAENQELRCRLTANEQRAASNVSASPDTSAVVTDAETEKAMLDLQTRVAKLEAENLTLASIAAAKLQVPTADLREALANAVEAALASDVEAAQRAEIAMLRSRAGDQTSEINRLQTVVNEQEQRFVAIQEAHEQEVQQHKRELQNLRQKHHNHRKNEHHQHSHSPSKVRATPQSQTQPLAQRGLDRDLPPPPAHLVQAANGGKSLRSKMRRRSFIPTLSGSNTDASSHVRHKENRTRRSADAVIGSARKDYEAGRNKGRDVENDDLASKTKSKKRLSTDNEARSEGPVRLKQKTEHSCLEKVAEGTPERLRGADAASASETPSSASPGTRALRMRVPRFRMRNNGAPKS
ncbi:Kinesin-like protein 6 [Hondaea fermentalgiana]|uniref:Kinesin-like protein n=1 Tax=Hondaea fermentalgiana TaxID=2315210 RepID=A0A2R5GRJ4_9STRA|nr:Kinesin-like protein 6 [Hondaea fermentalgiana]|eukprot:GBG32929.1 Kinesin-like protein 6 [Hondaea fermentalgiana]